VGKHRATDHHLELSHHYAPKVLIVDDDESQLNFLVSHLKGLDTKIFQASSGLEALKLTSVHDFALFMIDIHMPEMDGYALANEFKKNSGTRHVPIIFITAVDAKDFEFFKGYDLGAFDFLMKPFQRQIIQSKVKVFLQLYEHQRGALRMMVLEKQKLELQKQKLELEKSNQDLETFANVAAHDIKNPVHLVAALIKVVLEDAENKLTPTSLECLEKVRLSCERMQSMVNSILEFASVGAKQLARTEFGLSEVIDVVREDLSLQIKAANANLEANDLPKIEGSKDLLIQLFENLISNAIKYRDTSRPLIIKVEEIPSARKGDVSIAVRDNGIGMEGDFLDLIFQPFKRLINQSNADGCGIGLATVKKIIDAHLGSINVTSKLGEGTSFTLCLPRSSPMDDLRVEPRYPKLDDRSLKFYRLATELDPCEAFIIDESLNGFGCRLIGNRDIKMGDLLYLSDGRHFEVCWLNHDEAGNARFGLKLIPPV